VAHGEHEFDAPDLLHPNNDGLSTAPSQRDKSTSAYRLIGPVDPHQEQRLGDEEADAEVLVDGVAVALQPAEEAEGEDADEQAHQRQQDPHPRDDVQEQVVHAVRFLWREKSCLWIIASGALL